jgi:hypothetical protein
MESCALPTVLSLLLPITPLGKIDSNLVVSLKRSMVRITTSEIPSIIMHTLMRAN